MTPAPIVRHAEPPAPDKKRMTMRAFRLGAKAQPSTKAQNKRLEMFKIIRRPNISLRGP